MSEYTIVKHCAPTLAGLKTGNLFVISYEDEDKLHGDIERMNRAHGHKGLSFVVLRARGGRALIYVYRPKKLASDLDGKETKEILSRLGYGECPCVESCIRRLSHKIRGCENFPHEIGLFLGYPPEDVRGFMECKGKGFKKCGCWKVYGDVSEAEKLFCKYKKCTCVYMECLARGKSIDELIVNNH